MNRLVFGSILAVQFNCCLGGPHYVISLCLWNFNSIISIDVDRVKSYENVLLNPMGVPIWVAVNKLNFVPKGDSIHSYYYVLNRIPLSCCLWMPAPLPPPHRMFLNFPKANCYLHLPF